jgi:hypothetical protein
MPIHVVARGALIGGGVGAAFALARSGRGERTGNGVVRLAKSVLEGALAGAAVGFLLDRRLRDRAAEIVAERGPDLLDTALELATQAYDTARPQVEQVIDAARPAVEQAFGAARPAVEQVIDAARPAVAGLTTRLRAA